MPPPLRCNKKALPVSAGRAYLFFSHEVLHRVKTIKDKKARC